MALLAEWFSALVYFQIKIKLRLVKVHRKMLIEKGGSFMISIVVHDDSLRKVGLL